MTIDRETWIAKLREGVGAWNAFRNIHPEDTPDLSRADLTRANLTRADLRRANLRRADLSNADLMGANLREANLWEAGLYKADLTGADLTGANLTGAILTGAILTDAILDGVIGLNEKPPAAPGKEEKARRIAEANARVFAERAKAAVTNVDGHLSGKSADKAAGRWVDAAAALDELLGKRR